MKRKNYVEVKVMQNARYPFRESLIRLECKDPEHFELVAGSYADGSTTYAFLVFTKMSAAALEKHLRKELNYDGWLEVGAELDDMFAGHVE